MENIALSTKNTWCSGCGNFSIQKSIEEIISQTGKEDKVLVSGIGCHGKIVDYLNVNSFYALHGRSIPVATGIKMANKNLNVICLAGDGDTYNEGIAHLLHAAKRNIDITIVVHDNRVFALTVNQPTSTSPKGFKSTTSPEGNTEEAINPLDIVLAAGATFIARGYVGKPENLTRIIQEGIDHKGFSFIEVLQPCVAWHNNFSDYNERVYEMEKEYLTLIQAQKKIREWDYENENKIPLGVFYKIEKPTPIEV